MYSLPESLGLLIVWCRGGCDHKLGIREANLLREGCLLTGCFLADQIQQQCCAGAATPLLLLPPPTRPGLPAGGGGGGGQQVEGPSCLDFLRLLSPAPVNFEPNGQGEAKTGSDSSSIGNLPSLM